MIHNTSTFKLTICYIISRIFILLLAYTIILITFGETTVSYSKQDKYYQIKRLLPEGWAFFTRNPREDDYVPYLFHSGKLIKVPYYPIFTSCNHWGLGRKYKAINTEVSFVLNDVKSHKWVEQDTFSLGDIYRSFDSTIIVKAKVPNPLLIDTFCIISTKPIPWAWFSTTFPEDYPCKYIYVTVKK